jgi:hypothetical protein
LEVIAIIVDIVDHEEYNDIFGFKKKWLLNFFV